jgi:hypothetical protein
MVVAVLAVAIHLADAGCRGFFGPIPLPLWMSNMKLSVEHVTAHPGHPANVRSIIRDRLQRDSIPDATMAG